MESVMEAVFPLKPDVNKADVIDLLKRLYDFDAVCVTELVSYMDRNYYFKVSNEGDDINHHGYVVKLLNKKNSEIDCIDGLDKMSSYLNERIVSCPIPVPDNEGRLMSFHTFPVLKIKGCFKHSDSVEKEARQCSEFLVRVLNFIPGVTVREVERTPHIVYQCGELIAKMSNALGEFRHPVLNKRTTVWNLSNISNLRGLLHILKDQNDAGIVNDVLDKVEETLLNSKHLFCPGIIHCDPNDQNILLRKGNKNGEDVYDVCGLIDFAFAQSAYHVYDLAILICYLGLKNEQMDIYETIGHCLAGYFKHRGLNKAEFDALPVLMYGRNIQSVLFTTNVSAADPDNHYVFEASVYGWKLLREYPNYSQQNFYSKVKQVINSYDPNILPTYLNDNQLLYY
ncbi:Uncharacterised protein g4842 [Pycnogonum litorale]